MTYAHHLAAEGFYERHGYGPYSTEAQQEMSRLIAELYKQPPRRVRGVLIYHSDAELIEGVRLCAKIRTGMVNIGDIDDAAMSDALSCVKEAAFIGA